MLTITAAQHFFSSVPASQSPTGRRGYQTLAATPGLPADAVRAIEDRAQYATAVGDPLKWQFYGLPGGFLAMSQSAPLAEPDEFGRKGRYLTHTLVVEPATFAKLDGCPLDVLMQHPFATALDDAFRQVGPGKGQVPAARVELTPRWRDEAVATARRFDAARLTALGRLAWRAGELTAAGQPVTLVGTEREQFALLGLLFLLAAPDTRRLLSFDTNVAGCDFGRDVAFWAHGYYDAPAGRDAPLLLEPGAGRYAAALPAAGDGPYALWMARDALPGGIETAAREQAWAAALDQVIRTGRPPSGRLDVDRMPDSFIERFARLNPDAVAAPWVALLPAGLSPELQAALRSRLTARPGPLLAATLAGIQLTDVWDLVCETLFGRRAVPSPADRKALEPWIRAAQHPPLATLPPFWAGDEKSWLDRLAALSDDDYGYVLGGLAAWPVPPIPLRRALPAAERKGLPFLKDAKLPGLRRSLAAPEAPPAVDAAAVRRAALWVSVAGSGVAPEDWPKVLDSLAAAGEPALDAVADLLPQLGPEPRRAIERWLKGYGGSARALRSAAPYSSTR